MVMWFMCWGLAKEEMVVEVQPTLGTSCLAQRYHLPRGCICPEGIAF